MLIRHTLLYGVGTVVPGLIAFLGLSLYTRMLPPEVYGTYAAAMGTSMALAAIGFDWLRVGFFRFAGSIGSGRRRLFLTTAVRMLLATAAGFLSISCAADLIFGTRAYGFPWSLLALVAIAFGACEICLGIMQTALHPARHVQIRVLRAVSGLAIATSMLHYGFQAVGLLAGIIGSNLLAAAVTLYWYRKDIGTGRYSPLAGRRVLSFGLPISVRSSVDVLSNTADRLVLLYLLDAEAAGIYTVTGDLTRQALSLIANATSLAGLPLALRALSQSGPDAARESLSKYFDLLFALLLPIACGAWLLRGNIAEIMVGEHYRAGAILLMPLCVSATVLNSIRTYYSDFALELGRRPIQQLFAALTCLLSNIALNFVLIPRFGLLGVGCSAILSNLAALVVSLIMARRIFPLHFPYLGIGKVVIACLAMVLVLLPVADRHGFVWLLYQVLAGATVYALCVFGLDVHGIRQLVLGRAVAYVRGFNRS